MSIAHWIIGPQLIGFIMIVVGLIQKLYPPKRINNFYGYRSPTSQKNQLTWDEGNIYSAKLMIKIGCIAFIIGALITPFIDKQHQLISVALLMVMGIIIPVTIIALTEKHLNKLFDDNTK